MSSELEELFYNPKIGLTSTNKIYLKAKELGFKYTHKKIEDVIKKQYVSQVFNPIKRPKYFSAITEDKIRVN